jgi:hypothetical protein
MRSLFRPDLPPASAVLPPSPNSRTLNYHVSAFSHALGGYLPLAPGISTLRYPIPQRTFKYAATVQSVTDETCQFRTLLATRQRLYVLRTVGVEPARGVDFRWRHIAGNVAHLLADVVPPGAGGEGLQLAA